MRIVLFFMILGVFSCKKDKLKNEDSVLIGQWQWYETRHSYGFCNDFLTTEIITPASINTTHRIEILQKGIVNYYEGETFLKKDRLVFSDPHGIPCESVTNGYAFNFRLNNKEGTVNTFQGCVNADSMVVNFGFPYDVFEEGCEGYASYFVKL